MTSGEPFVIGIAAPGGLGSLPSLLGGLPVGADLAYVILANPRHLGDDAMVELQAATPMSLGPIEANFALQRGHAYLLPPDQSSANPIDDFFTTLADRWGPRSVGVLLAGGGADGPLGIGRVRERGGLCLVQETGPGAGRFNAGALRS